MAAQAKKQKNIYVRSTNQLKKPLNVAQPCRQKSIKSEYYVLTEDS